MIEKSMNLASRMTFTPKETETGGNSTVVHLQVGLTRLIKLAL